jgi:hypothetical protein
VTAGQARNPRSTAWLESGADTGHHVVQDRYPSGTTGAVTISPDGCTLVNSGAGGAVLLWD